MAKKSVKPAGAANTERAPEKSASATPAQTPDNESPAARKPWREQIKVHPAADLFPKMTEPELRELGEDIKKNRLQDRIKVLALKDDGPRQYLVLDGRNRLDAIESVMGPIKVFESPGSIPNQRFFEVVEDVDDAHDYVVSMNIRRRHLTSEQKREVIAKLLALKPDRSNRQVARDVGASHNTVSSVRTEMEGRGQLTTSATRTDTKGREQPAHKPSVKLPENVDAQYKRAEREARAAPPPEPPPAPSTGEISPDQILEIAFRVKREITRNDVVVLCDWSIAVAHQIIAASRKTGGGR